MQPTALKGAWELLLQQRKILAVLTASAEYKCC